MSFQILQIIIKIWWMDDSKKFFEGQNGFADPMALMIISTLPFIFIFNSYIYGTFAQNTYLSSLFLDIVTAYGNTVDTLLEKFIRLGSLHIMFSMKLCYALKFLF